MQIIQSQGKMFFGNGKVEIWQFIIKMCIDANANIFRGCLPLRLLSNSKNSYLRFQFYSQTFFNLIHYYYYVVLAHIFYAENTSVGFMLRPINVFACFR